mmetsp:Transcript_2027/g.3714  ORF Transcript_2027/g.3714 Transcript_2027/m.3714 type:complete len:310 (+) Transcript_2027:1316-2245(+)
MTGKFMWHGFLLELFQLIFELGVSIIDVKMPFLVPDIIILIHDVSLFFRFPAVFVLCRYGDDIAFHPKDIGKNRLITQVVDQRCRHVRRTVENEQGCRILSWLPVGELLGGRTHRIVEACGEEFVHFLEIARTGRRSLVSDVRFLIHDNAQTHKLVDNSLGNRYGIVLIGIDEVLQDIWLIQQENFGFVREKINVDFIKRPAGRYESSLFRQDVGNESLSDRLRNVDVSAKVLLLQFIPLLPISIPTIAISEIFCQLVENSLVIASLSILFDTGHIEKIRRSQVYFLTIFFDILDSNEASFEKIGHCTA